MGNLFQAIFTQIKFLIKLILILIFIIGLLIIIFQIGMHVYFYFSNDNMWYFVMGNSAGYQPYKIENSYILFTFTILEIISYRIFIYSFIKRNNI